MQSPAWCVGRTIEDMADDLQSPHPQPGMTAAAP